MSLTNGDPQSTFAGKREDISLKTYSRGMGALGLPGDASSTSRFIKATFVKLNSLSADSEPESVSQFFHILRSVEMQRGCVLLKDGLYEITQYSSCCNTERGIYYYTTYDNSRVYAVNMHRENLQGSNLISYVLKKDTEIAYQN